MARWTQEQAVAYEVAVEAGTMVCAMITSRIAELQEPGPADDEAIQRLTDQRRSWSRERDALKVADSVSVADFTARASAIIREGRSRDAERVSARVS